MAIIPEGFGVDDLHSQVAALKAENARLAKALNGRVRLKVSEKGAVSIYGFGRWPITIYKGPLRTILGMRDDIELFMLENEALLKEKE